MRPRAISSRFPGANAARHDQTVGMPLSGLYPKGRFCWSAEKDARSAARQEKRNKLYRPTQPIRNIISEFASFKQLPRISGTVTWFRLSSEHGSFGASQEHQLACASPWRILLHAWSIDPYSLSFGGIYRRCGTQVKALSTVVKSSTTASANRMAENCETASFAVGFAVPTPNWNMTLAHGNMYGGHYLQAFFVPHSTHCLGVGVLQTKAAAGN